MNEPRSSWLLRLRQGLSPRSAPVPDIGSRGPLEKADFARAAGDGLIDLSKALAFATAKDEVAGEFLSDLFKTAVPELVKASTGVVGKLIVAAILKQFDTTSKRLRALEAHIKERDNWAVEQARRKFECALNYPSRSAAERRYGHHLFHEARQSLELALPVLLDREMSTYHLHFAILVCCLQVPGGDHHADHALRDLIDSIEQRATALERSAKDLEEQADRARYYIVQEQVGEKSTGRVKFIHGLEVSDGLAPVYEDSKRERGPVAIAEADKLLSLAKDRRKEAEDVRGTILVARSLMKESGTR